MSYKSDSQLLDLLADVRDRVIRIETKMETLPELHADVKKHESEIVKMHAQIRAIKWLAGLLFVTIPASAATLIKAFRP